MLTYAFIDHSNLVVGVRSLGWKLDFKRFRIYLREKFSVDRAFIFLGYVPNNTRLYERLRDSGFELIFKPIQHDGQGRIKGNCDADLVLHAVLKRGEYDYAVIVSGDGDFYSLVKLLLGEGKLQAVLAPSKKHAARLIRRAASSKFIALAASVELLRER